MLRSVPCALALALLFAGWGCVSSAAKSDAGSAGGAGGAGNSGGSANHEAGAPTGGTGGSTTPDAATGPPKTCQEVRVCIHNCAQDMACAGKCVSTAPTAVRQQYQEIQACSMVACPQQDEPCRCEQECFADGMCFDLVETCDDGVGDPWCDVRCH
jgi:hypothetical protein